MRHPTMEDVAREASVSRALVSLVFRDSPKVAEDTRSRVIAAADRLGYRPNANARRLASRTFITVGVLLRDMRNPFFADVVDGIEATADRAGIHLLFGHARGTTKHESAAIETLLEFRPNGLVLLSPSASTRSLGQQIGLLPTVVIGREVRRRGFDTVVDDDAGGAALAVQHLHSLGHRNIVHVSGGTEAGAAQRIRGYERTMRSLGLAEHIRVIPGTFTEEAGLAAAKTLAVDDNLPTAVFAANDLLAVGVLSGFDHLGIRVPEEVSIVGYDDTSLARTRHIDLTTIDQPRHAMGELALETLLHRLRRGRDRSVIHRTAPSLVVRSSSGPAPTAEDEEGNR